MQTEPTMEQAMATEQKKQRGESWPLPGFWATWSIFFLIRCRPTYVVQAHVGFASQCRAMC